MAITNREISKLFRLGAQLLELHDENQFKVRSYDNAAQAIRVHEAPLALMDENELEQIQGIGKNLVKKVVQARKTGSYDELDRLMELTPPGVLEMLGIKGLGAKKIRAVWLDLGITSPEELLQACKDGRVEKLRGFGKKTQENVLEMIEYFFESRNMVLYAEAEYEALRIIDFLKKQEGVADVMMTGPMRRKMPIIGEIDLLILLEEGYSLDAVLNASEALIARAGKGYETAELGIALNIHTASTEDKAEKLLRTTGNEQHLALLLEDTFKGATTEEEIYKRNKLPYIIPEMREGRGEEKVMAGLAVDDIIRYDHIKGCLHNHSTYSDGAGTLEQMAQKCIDLGLEYFGICDHSQAAFYANGLQPKRVLAQWKEIDKLNEKLAPFKIFKGIESDILNDGSLDYDEDMLKGFDFVVGSVHSNLKMNEQVGTQRLIKAIENPYLTILGHMTGRLLLMRKGFPVDYKKVIDACASNGVVIEINANPRRLDMDWQWLQYAIRKDVKLSINPDAHDMDEIPNMYYGVCVARKGGVTHDMVLNTYSRAQIEEYFLSKKGR